MGVLLRERAGNPRPVKAGGSLAVGLQVSRGRWMPGGDDPGPVLGLDPVGDVAAVAGSRGR